MTATPLSVKLAWFDAEPDIVEKVCIDCGDQFEAPKLTAWRTKRCADCTIEHKRKGEPYYKVDHDEPPVTGVGEIDLVTAIIRQAIIDGRGGNDEARQFLRADDGAELYLKLVGVDVDDTMKDRLFWIGKKRQVKHKDTWRMYEGRGADA